MTTPKLALVLVCLMPVTLGPKEAPQEAPKEAKVTPLFSKDLPDFPGKEGLMITVEYPPGASDPVPRMFTSSAETRAKPNRRNS